jgi:hypothetical protein
MPRPERPTSNSWSRESLTWCSVAKGPSRAERNAPRWMKTRDRRAYARDVMNPVAVLAKVRIEIPPEAILPLAIGVVALLVLLFAGAALATWKEKNPEKARTVGIVAAALLSGYAIYLAAYLLPNKYIDLGPPDQPPITLADGPILGFTALMATIMWGFAERRKMALGFGGLLGVAMVVKPFVMPLVSHFSSGSERVRGFTEIDTLTILGPGIAVVITALIVGRRT